ncbi:MAG: hypothetical protein ONB31_00395 [candidate division KSB1 bacterium]|nr:hypothetical protein [candidate division KSB1 bacterium]MDZ7335097.1 hypothetical protein [candidate division KSB1 bacterium]MDZ7356234.1 hypothetical protein [candidate division KSB1 bacterium]MDZ7400039.1 hypothetical protein [candidate division KSB1 bacterium]
MNKDLAPQEQIENFMKEVVTLGNYEMAYLLSQEGLLLAQSKSAEVIPEDRLVEMAILFQEIQKMADVMAGIDEIKELTIEGANKRKIIFRLFNAFGQTVTLVLIISPGRSYRGLTNRLVRLIQKVSD